MNATPLEQFLWIVLSSYLVDDIHLRECMMEFKRMSHHAGDELDELRALNDFLISRGVLTRWQCDMLSKGKFKGFFLDNYVFLDRLRVDATSTLYSARNRKTGAVVTLEVASPTSAYEGIRYEIV